MRLDHLEASRLAWAFALSVAIHLLVWGGYTAGQKLHVWERIHWPAWMQALAQPLTKTAKKEQAKLADREAPLMFIDVSPQQATVEPPKNAAFYSDRNSLAANPDATKDSDVPKITGSQTQVPKTEDVPRERFPLQPSPPKTQEAPAEEARPKPALAPGDLTLAKADVTPRPDTGTADLPRPRTIREAMARQHVNQLAGQKMKQEGGARRQALVPSFDVKETAFGAYDRAFVDAVQQRWFDLLDNISFDSYRRGKVVLKFHLNYDGRITEMNIADNNVGEMLSLLCQKAVLDPSPFDKWPREMRLVVGADFREIQFTFYYN